MHTLQQELEQELVCAVLFYHVSKSKRNVIKIHAGGLSAASPYVDCSLFVAT